MDIVRFLNDVTGGHLLAWKVTVASFVFLLAAFQVALAARFWGVGGLPIAPATAASLHRWSGRAVLAGALVVGFACLIGPAGNTSPARVLAHSLFGSLLFAVLIVKFALLKLVRNRERLLPAAGIALFVSFFAIWVTSVADYVSAR